MDNIVRRKFEEERLTWRSNIMLRAEEAKFVKDVLCKEGGSKSSFNTAIRRLINEKKNLLPVEKQVKKRIKKA